MDRAATGATPIPLANVLDPRAPGG